MENDLLNISLRNFYNSITRRQPTKKNFKYINGQFTKDMWITFKHIKKGAQHHYSLGKWKLKLQWNTTAHLLERLKLRTLKIPKHFWGCETTGILTPGCLECKVLKLLWKTIW